MRLYFYRTIISRLGWSVTSNDKLPKQKYLSPFENISDHSVQPEKDLTKHEK